MVPLRHGGTFANRGGLVFDGKDCDGDDIDGKRLLREMDGNLYVGRRSNMDRFCGNFLQHHPSIPGRIIDGGNILTWTSLINCSMMVMVGLSVVDQNVLNFNLTLVLRVPLL